jgi:mannose-6-phosphate isomerase-like protein (cupin superfamily)
MAFIVDSPAFVYTKQMSYIYAHHLLMLTAIDIQQLTKGKNEYFNEILTGVNDHVIRVSVMTRPYFWHLHPNSDETFLVIEGCVIIDLESSTIELLPGQLFTIPRNIKHRTRPKGDRSVNLTIERADLETINLE